MQKKQNGKFLEIQCNRCGKKLLIENGELAEGCFFGKQNFGYFSRKDRTTQSFELCEDCYDQWIGSFKVPVTEKEETELL